MFDHLESYPLHYAVARGAVEEIENMINDDGAIRAVNEFTFTGLSPLMVAAMLEDGDEDEDDEEDEDSDDNELDNASHTPSMASDIESLQRRIMRILLDANADPNGREAGENVDEEIESTALMVAASRGSLVAMQVLLDANADVNLLCNSPWPTALFHAAKIGSCEKIQLLLDAKASTGINIANENQETAADIAELHGHSDVVQLLLDAKATPRDDWCRMRDACIEGRTEDVKSVLDAGYNLGLPNFRGRHPLLLATKHNHTDIAQLLIAARAQLDVQDQDEMTPLMHSITLGNLGLARSLINAKANPSRGGTYDKTPFTCAVTKRDMDALRMLIDAKARFYFGDQTPLTLAIDRGFEDVVRLLLDAKVRPDVADTYDPPLHYAIKRGDEQIVKMLLAANARIEYNRRGVEDAIAVAARHNKPSIIRLLIDAKAQLEKPGLETTYSWYHRGPYPLLTKAIECGSVDAIRCLVEAKAKIYVPGTRNDYDLTRCAIDASAKFKNGDTLKCLLDAKASLALEKWGSCTLDRASEANCPWATKELEAARNDPDNTLMPKLAVLNHVREGKALLARKIDIDYAYCASEQTALMIAAENKSLEFVQMLIENKASLDLGGKYGKSALYYAICKNGTHPAAPAVVKTLADARASLENIIFYRKTPLFEAVSQGLSDITKVLVDAGASLESRNSEGKTPLFEAVSQGNSDITKVLVEANANIDVKHQNGMTLLMCAARSGAMDIVEILLDANPASFDAQDNKGMTALMHAVCSDKDTSQTRRVRMLLEHIMARWAAKSNDEEPPAKRLKKK